MLILFGVCIVKSWVVEVLTSKMNPKEIESLMLDIQIQKSNLWQTIETTLPVWPIQFL